jgi:multiple sugar transport system permease protein
MKKIVLTPYLLILPAVTTLFLLFLYPIAWNAYISVHDVQFTTFNKEWVYVKLENYQALIDDSIFPSRFHQSLTVSLQFVVGSVLGQFILGLGLALALHTRLKGREVFRMLITVPWIMSELVVAYIWLYMYSPGGAVNNVLIRLGLPSVNWLGDLTGAIWALVLTNIWYGMPFTLLMMGGALTTISPDLIEAASVDGASRWQVFRSIIWPLIAPFAALNLILITMWTTNLFALPLAMTKGGPLYSTTTTSLYMYRQAFEFGNFSVGSSIGVLLFLFNLVVAAIYLRSLRTEV